MSLMANGVGSGLDINGIVEQLMQVERRPLAQLAAKEGSFQAQLSAFGQLKSVLSTLQGATNALRNGNLYNALNATSSNPDAFTAIASNTASPGKYSLEVLQIAQGQRIVTNDTTAPSVGAGSLTINFGRYDYDNDGQATAFNLTSSATVELEAGGTLEDLRDAINASSAPIRASVIDNGTAKQLIIAGNGEGAGSAFTLQGTGGLSGFSYNATDTDGSTLSELEQAQDSRIRVDGVTLTRSSNTIGNVIDGVTINLLRATEGRETLTVANDRAGVKSAIQKFVEAYNEFNTLARSLTAYNPETQQGGLLTGDSTARSLQSQLRNALGAVNLGGEGIGSLSELGISFQRDGSLTINNATLDAKLNDPNAKVGQFFAGGEGVTGFATSLSARLGGFLNEGGLINARQDGLNSSIRSINRQGDTLSRRLDAIEQRYRDQFTALDTMIASMSQTSTFLQQQLANLPSISNNR